MATLFFIVVRFVCALTDLTGFVAKIVVFRQAAVDDVYGGAKASHRRKDRLHPTV
jgi:hypothetical protein